MRRFNKKESLRLEAAEFRLRMARTSAFVLALALAGQAGAAFITSKPSVDSPRSTWIPESYNSNERAVERDVAVSNRPNVRGATTLRLKIINEQRAPRMGARIFVNSSVSTAKGESDASGVASLVVPTGRAISGRVVLLNYEVEEFTIPECKQETSREIILKTAPPLRGRIVDETGEPVAGAEVMLQFRGLSGEEEGLALAAGLPRPDTTDISGQFTFPHAQRRGVLVQARKAGYVIAQTDPASVNLPFQAAMNDGFGGKQTNPNDPGILLQNDLLQNEMLANGRAAIPGGAPMPGDLHLCMTRAGSVEGVVRDSSGKGIAGCLLVAVDLEGYPGPFETPCTTKSGEGGWYRMNEVPPGRRIVVRAKSGTLCADSAETTVPACETRSVDVPFARSGR